MAVPCRAWSCNDLRVVPWQSSFGIARKAVQKRTRGLFDSALFREAHFGWVRAGGVAQGFSPASPARAILFRIRSAYRRGVGLSLRNDS